MEFLVLCLHVQGLRPSWCEQYRISHLEEAIVLMRTGNGHRSVGDVEI